VNYYLSIQKVIDYIEVNLKEKLDSKQLADSAGFSKSHFLLIFQVYTNYSLMSYIRMRRLCMAAKAIKESNDTITDISYSFCFESHDVFSRAFKRTYGITPYQYRVGNYLLSDFKKIELYYNEMEDIMTKSNIVTSPQMYLIGIERRIEEDGVTAAQVWDLYFNNWESLFGGITNRVNPDEDVDYALC
jgi:AraC family transcriptional regulator